MKTYRTAVLFIACFAILLGARVATSAGGDAPPNPPDKPYNMLVLGDSVVWGQGLDPAQKFSTLVRNDIAAHLGREVLVTDKSHSGATIKPRYKGTLTEPGEVPIPTPTLWEQLDAAIAAYKCEKRVEKNGQARGGNVCKDVDMVLLNGGVNDVGLETVLNPFMREKTIEKRTRKYCFHSMTELLTALMATFENATIVVVGYYPMICMGEGGTDPNMINDLIGSFLGRDKCSRNDIKRSKGKLSRWLLERIGKRSAIWKTRSDIDLADSVAKANETAGSSRSVFVKVDFQPNECYAGTQTKLWKLKGFDANGDPETDDGMLAERLRVCPQAAKDVDGVDMNPFLRLLFKGICKPAGTGHPNVAGAKKYEEAIWAAIKPRL